MLGNEALVPFEGQSGITKSILSLRPGILSYKKTFEKISSIFSVLFLDDAFFPKRPVAGGNPYYFLGEEFGSVARKNATPLFIVAIRSCQKALRNKF